MHNEMKITQDMYWIGASDRRLALFEGVYSVPTGVSYNSYLVLDDKTVVFDTVDKAVTEPFIDNITFLLAGRPLDYLVVDHMEPDHTAAILMLAQRYPDMRIVCTDKAKTMMGQFFDLDLSGRIQTVGEGDTLKTGRHVFAFCMAPMVHWPEVMVSYDTVDKILYSADAFGAFGALSGQLYADQIDFEHDWLDEARRYYANIVGKYGPQVMALLDKAAKLDIRMICPLHGPVWRSHLNWLINKYIQWASYTPEVNGVLIVYASIYGHTANAADILASELDRRGVLHVKEYDASVTHTSTIVSEAFKYSHIVFASSTYNMGVFYAMENVLADFKAHQITNRTIALIENGSWAPASGRLMRQVITAMPGLKLLDDTFTIKSALKADTHKQLLALADAIAATLPAQALNPNAMFKLTYGLFVLTARQDGRDNGCIINTAAQVTDSPRRISIAVIKGGRTHDMIAATGVFNVSVLTEKASFDTFKHFGMQSGKTVDKFAGMTVARSDNGLAYLDTQTNAVISGKVISAIDMGTHTLFIAEVTQEKVLNDDPSVTYGYYQSHIKPKAKPADPSKPKKRWVCKICGFIYEGDELPKDYICPLCKHDASYFEPLV